jgi:hypothetical protein
MYVFAGGYGAGLASAQCSSDHNASPVLDPLASPVPAVPPPSVVASSPVPPPAAPHAERRSRSAAGAVRVIVVIPSAPF